MTYDLCVALVQPKTFSFHYVKATLDLRLTDIQEFSSPSSPAKLNELNEQLLSDILAYYCLIGDCKHYY